MKNILLIFGMIFILSFTVLAYGGGMMHNSRYDDDYKSELKENKEITEFIIKLKDKYEIKEEEKLDPEKLTDKELEKIGKILMDTMMPNSYHHKYMEKVMGGEGSKSLSEMRRHMAYRYLQGYGFAYKKGYRGCFDEGDRSYKTRSHHRGFWKFWKKDKRNKDLTALELLKKRYVNGEITKEQYKEMKMVLSE